MGWEDIISEVKKIPDLGAKADTAVTDPTAAASIIAGIKGLLKQMQGNGAGSAPVDLATSLSSEFDTIDVNRMSKGGITVAHNAITATATSASPIDFRGFNAAHIDFEITAGSGKWDCEILGSSLSGGTFSSQYSGDTQLKSLGLTTNAGFIVPIGANYIKIAATRIDGYATVTIRVTPLIIGATAPAAKWGAAVILAATDAYGGAASDLAADQAYDYSGNIDLATPGYTGITGTLEYDSSGTTDNIVLSVFGSLDGANYDDTPIWSITCTATSGADTQVSFAIKDYPHLRIGVKTTGTTNTFDYRITYRPFR